MINFGMIGCGYWGKNIARNIYQNGDCNLSHISDLNESNLSYINKNYPNTKTTLNADEVFKNTDLDIVGIFTPPKTHYKLIMKALENDKHVLVTKPLCLSVSEAEKIKVTSEKKQLRVFLDDTFSCNLSALQNYSHIFNCLFYGDYKFNKSKKFYNIFN